jgi:hypothetical protein
MLIIFLDFKRILLKEFVLAGQTVNSAYYCDVSRRLLENVSKFRPQIWIKKLSVASLQRTVSHFVFTREFFTANNMTAVPHPRYFPLFPRLKMQLKGHFDTAEVIETELQTMLNTLTEHDIP